MPLYLHPYDLKTIVQQMSIDAIDRVEQYSIAMGLVQRGAKLNKGVYEDGLYGLFPRKNAFSKWYRLVYVKIAIMSVKVNNPSVPISLLDKDTRRKLCSFLY
jgi:hypothetical protein